MESKPEFTYSEFDDCLIDSKFGQIWETQTEETIWTYDKYQVAVHSQDSVGNEELTWEFKGWENKQLFSPEVIRGIKFHVRTCHASNIQPMINSILRTFTKNKF